jgi:hypothetical protein
LADRSSFFRSAVLAAGAAALVLGPAAHAAAWGPAAHERITSEAIDTLPKGLRPFYRAHRLEMPSLSVESAAADDTPDRRFMIDRLVPFPFTDVPRTEAAMKERFGEEEAKKVGRLPWLVQESYAKLVEAFKSGDKERILAESDTLSGYVADLSNPFALTENSDGQKTGQHGLWMRFGTRLHDAMDKQLKLGPEAARYLDDPAAQAFASAGFAYIWLDNILYEEALSRRGQSGYGELYFETLAKRAGPLLKARLEQAATDVGSYWYTAWTAAGRPELK